jgi:flagellar hook-associated protein 2
MVTSSGISSLGVGSGLDANSIVSQLVALERRPLQNLQRAAQEMQTQVSSLGQLQNLMGQLKDAAAQLAKPTSFTAMNVSSSDASTTAASTTGSGALAAGSFSITTTQLAASQTLVSASNQFSTPSALVGAGTLTLRLGQWAGDLSAFTPKTGSADVAIAVTADDTLATLRDKVNAANSGVSASIVNDGSGSRLTLRSTATGAENGFRLSVSDADGVLNDAAGLSRLAFDPPNAPGNLSRTVAAADALAQINGIDVRSASNTLSGVVEGLTVTLNKLSTTPVQLNVTSNTELVKTQVNTFVSVFNQAARFFAEQTRYDEGTKRAGLFQGDATVLGLYNQMRQIAGGGGGNSSVFTNLSSMGIERQRDGTLSVNASKLDSALTRLPELAKALSNKDTVNPANDGLAVKLQNWTDGLLSASGALPGRNESLRSRLRSNERDQERVNQRAEQVEARLRAQYTALDRQMAQLNVLQGFVSQQITQFNANSGSNQR